LPGTTRSFGIAVAQAVTPVVREASAVIASPRSNMPARGVMVTWHGLHRILKRLS
jgi:hypothetical protein